MSKLPPRASINITRSHVKLASPKIPYAIHGSIILRVYLPHRYYPEMVPLVSWLLDLKKIYFKMFINSITLLYTSRWMEDRCLLSLWTIIPLLIIKTYQETSPANQACESSRSIYPPSHVTQYFLNIQSRSNSNLLKKEIKNFLPLNIIFMYISNSKALLTSILHKPNQMQNYFVANMFFKHLVCSQCTNGRISNSSQNE